MSCNCQEVAEKGKKDIENSLQIPFAVHESAMARAERVIKRQWIAIILLICMLFGAFGLFVWYESLYETVSYEQDVSDFCRAVYASTKNEQERQIFNAMLDKLNKK